jgi:hypothetical protein
MRVSLNKATMKRLLTAPVGMLPPRRRILAHRPRRCIQWVLACERTQDWSLRKSDHVPSELLLCAVSIIQCRTIPPNFIPLLPARAAGRLVRRRGRPPLQEGPRPVRNELAVGMRTLLLPLTLVANSAADFRHKKIAVFFAADGRRRAGGPAAAWTGTSAWQPPDSLREWPSLGPP